MRNFYDNLEIENLVPSIIIRAVNRLTVAFLERGVNANTPRVLIFTPLLK